MNLDVFAGNRLHMKIGFLLQPIPHLNTVFAGSVSFQFHAVLPPGGVFGISPNIINIPETVFSLLAFPDFFYLYGTCCVITVIPSLLTQSLTGLMFSTAVQISLGM